MGTRGAGRPQIGGKVSRLGGPDLLTAARFPIGAAMIAASLASPYRLLPTVAALFALGIVTDLVDGPWARRRGSASERGARLDSAADAALAIAVTVALVRGVDVNLAPWAWWAIAAVAALRLAALAVTYVRFRLVSIAHTWANKGAGLAVAATALWALASGSLPTWAVAGALAVACASAAEELLMASTARAYRRDRRGIWDSGETHEHRSRRHEVDASG